MPIICKSNYVFYLLSSHPLLFEVTLYIGLPLCEQETLNPPQLQYNADRRFIDENE